MTVGTLSPTMTFSVKAYQAVYIALSEIPGVTTTATYEIAIGVGAGPNTVIQIRNGTSGPIMATSAPSNYIGGGVEKDFWISWENGAISVGQGTEADEVRLVYWKPASTFPINAAHMTGDGPSPVRWTFGESHG